MIQIVNSISKCLAIAGILSSVLISCEKVDKGTSGNGSEQTDPSTGEKLGLTKTEISIDYFAQQITSVGVKSNTAWSIVSDASWMSVSPLSGFGDSNITLTVTQNDTNEDRTAIVLVATASKKLYSTITVSQSCLNGEGGDGGDDGDGGEGGDGGDGENPIPTDPYDSGVKGEIADSFESGIGTAADPYIIRTASQLRKFANEANALGNTFNGKHLKLAADIVFNKNVLYEDGKLNTMQKYEEWVPIQEFRGSFDGNGHTISGLYVYFMYGEGDYAGLFQKVYKGSIKNLTIRDSYFRGFYAGPIAGYAYAHDGTLKVENCATYARVEGCFIGGLFGAGGNWHMPNDPLTYMYVQKCVSNCIIQNDVNNGEAFKAGGIFGSGAAVIRECISNNDIMGTGHAGGIVGRGGGSTIKNCVVRGNISSTQIVGGITGWSRMGSVDCSYSIVLAKLDVDQSTDTEFYAGCLVGYNGNDTRNTSKYTNCFWLGELNTFDVAGDVNNKAKFTNCRGVSDYEMKSSSMLSTLKSGGSVYWTTGDDGYPTLSW
ncbi:MAG: BACON domain-containing protein [Rikenellaceae bacterium]|nr:BACON domain-containing protein [Rikenellaceae bacterium]